MIWQEINKKKFDFIDRISFPFKIYYFLGGKCIFDILQAVGFDYDNELKHNLGYKLIHFKDYALSHKENDQQRISLASPSS